MTMTHSTTPPRSEFPTRLWVKIALAAAIIAYSLYFSLYQIQRHRALWTFIDLANMEQTIWNTLHGRFMRYTIYPATSELVTDFTDRITESRLGEHVQPILLLLMLPYALAQRPETLLILMSAGVGLGALPFYRIVQRRLHSDIWALLFALGYLLLPAIQTANGWDLHGTSFTPALLLAAIDAAECRRPGWWWVWSLLAMSGREDMPFLVGWGMLFTSPKELRRQARIMAGVGLLLSCLNFFVIIPTFGGGQTPYLAFFTPNDGGAGGGLLAALLNVEFWWTKLITFILYNFRLGAPFLFLYWLHWPSLLAMAPTLIINSLSRNAATIAPAYSHYSLPLIAWALVGAVEGYQTLCRRLTRLNSALAWRPTLGGGLLIAILATQCVEGYTPLNPHFVWPQRMGQEASIAALLTRIPADAPVALDMHLATHSARRPTLRIFPDLRGVEWVMVNVWQGGYPYGMQAQTWQTLFSDPTWETVAAQDGLILLRKGQGPPQGIPRAFARPAAAASQFNVAFGDAPSGASLRAVRVNPLPAGNFYLCTDWQLETAGELKFYVVTPGGEGPQATLLEISRIYPALTAQPGDFRDCTRLMTPPRGKTVTVQFYVADETGDRLPAAIVEPAGAGENLRAEADTLSLTLPAWW